jgi:competence protein ComEC
MAHMAFGIRLVREGVQALFARRPAVPAAMALIAGIAGASVFPYRPMIWLCIIGGLTTAAIILRRFNATGSFLLLASLFFIGITAAQLESFCFPAAHIANFTSDEPRLAEIELRLIGPPRTLAAAQQGRPLPPKEFVRAEVVRVKTRTGWERATGEVTLTIDQPHPRLAIGQRIAVVGLLQRPAPAMNPGEFDAAAYYRRQRVLATVTVPHVDGVTILEEARFSPLDSLREKARHLLADGFTQNHSLDHAVLLALTLGDRDPDMRGVQDDFSHSGTAHLLAVSGLHVILIAGFALLLCRLIGLHPRAATCVMMLVTLAYSLIALPAPPVLRATVLCLAFGFSQLMRRHRDGIQTLALCAIGLLLHHPHDLFGAGFQLSFLTVLGMLMYAPRIHEWSAALLADEDMRVARSFRPPGFWVRTGLYLRARFVGSLAIGCVAWLVSMPLVAFHFDQINPWAVFAGLLLLPVVALGLIAGLLKILLTLLLPGFAHTWAALATMPMLWMRREVNWLAHLPGANVPMTTPPIWQIVLFYLLLALPLVPWTIPSIKRWIRCAPAAAAAMLAMVPMLPMLIAASPSPADGETRITLLAIGAGQIGIIETADGRTLLIDDGSSSLADPLRKCLGPYLRSRGCRAIDAVYLSHPDFDHISAVAETADAYPIGRVLLSPVFRGQARDSLPAMAMLHHLDEKHVPIETLARDRTIPLDADTALRVLWPPDGRAFTSTNNAGLVLKLECHGRSILFPADIQAPTERELIDHPEHLRADILVAPHHGSAETTTAEFIKAVGPRSILGSNDRRLSKKQRDFDKLAAALDLYRTSRCGAITVHISKKGEVRIETFLKPKEQAR